MTRGKRRAARDLGVREANAIAGHLGREACRTRRQRRWTQEQLGDKVGVSQAEISKLEAGKGARTPIETWVAIGIALDRPIAIGFGRDVVAPLADAGHLDAQELVARMAVESGWRVRFEMADDPRSPARHTDLRLDRNGDIVLVEIWNRLEDLGAATRSTDRKVAAVASSSSGRVVHSLWLLLDTVANREIVRRYPTIFRARFTGSSAGWVRALTMPEAEVPKEPGVAWIDVRSAAVRAMRLTGG
jgi:transcriptional regulator with XRE-family HTH domain